MLLLSIYLVLDHPGQISSQSRHRLPHHFGGLDPYHRQSRHRLRRRPERFRKEMSRLDRINFRPLLVFLPGSSVGRLLLLL